MPPERNLRPSQYLKLCRHEKHEGETTYGPQ